MFLVHKRGMVQQADTTNRAYSELASCEGTPQEAAVRIMCCPAPNSRLSISEALCINAEAKAHTHLRGASQAFHQDKGNHIFSGPTSLGNSLPSLLISLTDKSFSEVLWLAFWPHITEMKQTEVGTWAHIQTRVSASES